MTSNATREIRENSLGWMIQRISGALNREMTARLAACDMSLPQFAVMMTVLEHDGLPQSEIAEIIHAPAYAVSRAVDRLEEQGRIERRNHVTSRRAVAVHATAEAHALAPMLHEIVSEANQALLEPIPSPEDRDRLKALLKLILPIKDRAS